MLTEIGRIAQSFLRPLQSVTDVKTCFSFLILKFCLKFEFYKENM